MTNTPHDVPEGHRWCYMCATARPSAHFLKTNREVCRDCRTTLVWTEMTARRYFLKACSHCPRPQPLTAFQRNGDGTLESRCRVAQRAGKRRERATGGDGYRKRWYTALKRRLRCAHCGATSAEIGPAQMHLVHLDPATKRFEIASPVGTMRDFRDEIRGCEALCRACAEAVTGSVGYGDGPWRHDPLTPWGRLFAEVDAEVPRRTRPGVVELQEAGITWALPARVHVRFARAPRDAAALSPAALSPAEIDLVTRLGE